MRFRWLVAIAIAGGLAVVAWSVWPRASPTDGCRVRDLGPAQQQLAADQQALDEKIEDAIGQLGFATTKVERDAARERLDRLHAEAVDLRDRASWLQRLEAINH